MIEIRLPVQLPGRPPLSNFDAETKRSSLTLRQTIRAKDKGKLWIPARLSIADDKIVVTTDDGTREIRPRRLSWQEPNKFLLSGVDRNSNVQRILLRFKTTDNAVRTGRAR